MASELNIQSLLNFNKGGASIQANSSGSVTVAGTKYIKKIVSIATTDTTVVVSEVSNIGWVMIKNLDATNFVTFGADGSSYPLKAVAGEPASVLRWNGAAIHALADTAACLIELTIIEQ